MGWSPGARAPFKHDWSTVAYRVSGGGSPLRRSAKVAGEAQDDKGVEGMEAAEERGVLTGGRENRLDGVGQKKQDKRQDDRLPTRPRHTREDEYDQRQDAQHDRHGAVWVERGLA